MTRHRVELYTAGAICAVYIFFGLPFLHGQVNSSPPFVELCRSPDANKVIFHVINLTILLRRCIFERRSLFFN